MAQDFIKYVTILTIFRADHEERERGGGAPQSRESKPHPYAYAWTSTWIIMSLAVPHLPELEAVSAPDATSSSCFHRLEVSEHISLLPCFVGRLSQGILEHLNKKLLRYSQQYRGVLLAYSKPCVQQTHGRILDEQPHIHFDLQYTAYVFRPVIGSIVCGTVNKVGGDHVGCLVYDCFNASVFSEHRERKERRTLNGLFTSQFMVGSKIWFRVVSMENISGILSIIGEHFDLTNLTQERSIDNERGSHIQPDSSMDFTTHDHSRDNDAGGEGACTVTPKRKKKKKKRSKEKSNEEQSMTDSSQVETDSKTVKSSKKLKKKSRNYLELDVDDQSLFFEKLESGSDKVRRKRKKRSKLDSTLHCQEVAVESADKRRHKKHKQPDISMEVPKAKKVKLSSIDDDNHSSLSKKRKHKR